MKLCHLPDWTPEEERRRDRAVIEATSQDVCIWFRLGRAGFLALALEHAQAVDYRAMIAREVASARYWQEELARAKPADFVREELGERGGAPGTIRELEEQLCGEVLA